jgi:CSLREA domain-containing protein
VVFAIALVMAAPVDAATFSVTKLDDTLDGACNSDCSLREAIQAANVDATQDTVVLPSGTLRVELAGGATEDANAIGDLDIQRDLIIRGAGAGATIIQSFLPPPPSASTDRVLDVLNSLTDVELTDLTVAGGWLRDDASGTGLGGGIRSPANGVLTVERVVVRDNAVEGAGASAYGGGIYKSLGHLVVRDSAIYGNRAVVGFGYGGGIFLNTAGTTADLTNVSLVSNVVNQQGAGIFSNQVIPVQIAHVTVTGNQASMGRGAIGGDASAFRLRSSIVAGNTATTGGANCAPGFAPASDGGNVGDPVCGLTQPSDAQTLDARLGTFGGVPIPVAEPLADSPALDHAVGACPPADARGVSRPQGTACDAGAAERAVAVTPPRDNVAPAGSGLAFKPRSFVAERKGPSVAAKRPKRGSRVSYRLSEAASVRFRAQRRLRGKRRGKRCVTGKRARKLKGRRCRTFKNVRGSFTHSGRAGANAFRFRGRVANRSLKRGSYRLVGTPRDAAGNQGKAFRGSFTIVGRRR